jgi:NitT/TauT family transport system substrate-binding protein
MDQLQEMLVSSGVLEPAKRVPYEQLVVAEFAGKAK